MERTAPEHALPISNPVLLALKAATADHVLLKPDLDAIQILHA